MGKAGKRDQTGAGITPGKGYKIMERTYRCKNGVTEKTRYIVGRNAKRQPKRKGVTTDRKQEANFNGAVKRMARILNNNYTKAGGKLIGLDYSPEGIRKLENRAGHSLSEGTPEAMDAIRQAAETELGNWYKRIRRRFPGVKALMVTADLDGDTGEVVRIHHHVCLELPEKVSYDELAAAWKLGDTDIMSMWSDDDYTRLAKYLLRQVRRRPDGKKYRVSRNMDLPEITEREVIGTAKLRAPRGAKVREEYYAEDQIGQYIRYTQQDAPKKRGGKKHGEAVSVQPDGPGGI